MQNFSLWHARGRKLQNEKKSEREEEEKAKEDSGLEAEEEEQKDMAGEEWR